MATNFPKLKDADIKIQEALMAPKQVEPKQAHTKTYYSKNGKSLREDSGFFFFVFCLGSLLQHLEVPSLGDKSEV